MERVRGVALLMVVVTIALSSPVIVLGTPNINSAIIQPRVVNTCPNSSMTTVNEYPNRIVITDFCNGSSGSSNIHEWRLSSDGATPAVFNNGDAFRFCADLLVTGATGHVGLQIAPWWSNLEGLFEVSTEFGFIGASGGRLPNYLFPNIYYAIGQWIHLEVIYLPNGLSETSPATIEYKIRYDGTNYTSGPRAFSEGNPADDPPYGRWGILNEAQVGGYMEMEVDHMMSSTWSNICFEPLTVGVTPATWSQARMLYR